MRFSIQIFPLTIVLVLNIRLTAAVPGYQYIYPHADACRVSPHTTIIVRFEQTAPAALTNLTKFIRVSDKNGLVAGETWIASENRTIIFRPDKPFALGSTVHVSFVPIFSSAATPSIKQVDFKFYITGSRAVEKTFPLENEDEFFFQEMSALHKVVEESGARIMPNGVSVPSDFPHINVTTNIAPSEGYLFLNNRGRGTPYSILFDNDGSPVWYLRTTDYRRDFKVQDNGTITMMARDGGDRFLNYDENFNLIDEFWAVDGYSTDEHECIVLKDGHYLLIGLRGEQVDMSQYVPDGRTDAIVYETIFQEFTPEHEKIFEWRAWDYFEDIIQFLELEALQGAAIRFPHMNALDIDDDGHILLSSRNLSEVSKINRHTGDFIWRLGGPKNQFTFLNDELDGFKNQHAILSLGNNHYTVFDNGTSRQPSVSRGVEYEIDPDKKTARLVWEYRNPPGTDYSHYMGNLQRLPNGNSLINWAVTNRPKVTEVTPDGRVVYEMNWVSKDESYRVFRFPWKGLVKEPNLCVEPGGDGVILLFNKFGDKQVAYYNIYGATTSNPKTLMDTSKATLKILRNLENKRTYFFRVSAVDKNGKESKLSLEKSIYVNIKAPGQNMVLNGDFSLSKRNWILNNRNSASSTWTAVTKAGHIQIANGGLDRRSIEFYQGQMNLIKGKEYLLEFEAYAEADRVIEVMVCYAGDPGRNYSRIGLTALKNRKQKYSYVFTMLENTDFNAEVRFDVGAEEVDVFLDNIVLRENVNVFVEEKSVMNRPTSIALIGNFPNPFNPHTTICYNLPEKSLVYIRVYNLLGEVVQELVNVVQDAGEQQVVYNASQLGSGIYFYELDALSQQNGARFRAAKKMMVVK